MNNKVTMEQKNKLIPELRFPEFVKDGEWEENEVGKLFKFKQGFQVSVENQYSNFTNGRVRFIRIIDITNNYEPKRYIDNPGSDYLIKKEDLFMIRYGSPGVVAIGYDGIIANNLFRLIWNLDTKFNHIYWFYTFQKIEKSIYNLSGSSSMPAISFTTLDNFNISYTKNSLEQQKIADCLSSLDEVITVHSEKLEALQNHKKGLLQNFFPQEGQTTPNYRFPEFVNDGDWEEKELNELGELINGLTYSPNDVKEEGLLVLRSSNIQNGLIDLKDCVYVRKDIKGANISQSNDILVCVRNGSKALIGKNALIPENLPLATHGAFMTVFRAKNPHFVFQLFQTFFYETQVNGDLGATINSINGKNFLKYKFPFPKNPKEQQKIADCLMAVDDLITAATEKIEQLKAHKKGLMQGLFP